MTETSRRMLFLFVFALVFYVTGASFVQSFVNYPTWKLIGAQEFQAYHRGMSALIVKTMVLPWLCEIVFTLLLFRLRPRVLPAWALGAALALNLIALVSTALIQIPIQTQLGENGFSAHAIDKLLETDPIRWTAGIFRALLYFWMMSLVVRATVDGERAERSVQF